MNESAAALPGSTQRLAEGGAAAKSGAAELSSGVDAVAAGTAQLSAGSSEALAGAETLRDAGGELLANWNALDDASRKAALGGLVAGIDTLAGSSEPANPAGLGALSLGTRQLEQQVSGQLQPGTSALAASLGELSAGLDQLNSSAPALAQAVGEAASGAQRLSGASAELDRGAQSLALGTGELSSGARQLDSGSGELATALSSGAAEAPQFDEQQASRLGDLASSPVQLDAQRANPVSSNGAGLAPYFLALGLWIGAFACFMMLPAIPETLLRGRRSAPLTALLTAGRYALLGIAQAVFAVLLVRFVVGIEVADLPGLLGLAALTSVAFMALNQVLIALLGAPGRFIGLLLVVFQLASAGGTYPVQTAPELFQTLHGMLPLSYAVQGFRALIAGGVGTGGGVGTAVWTLLGWLAACIVLMTLAVIAQRRRLEPAGIISVPAS